MIYNFKLSLSKIRHIKLVILVLAFALPNFCFAQDGNNANQPVFNHAALCARNLKENCKLL